MHMVDRVAVVTGAGRGNGRAISLRLAEAGATVVVSDVDDVAISRVVAEIEGLGGRAVGAHCDVSDEDDNAAVMTLAEKLGGPHAVVAQAGVTFTGPLDHTTVKQWDWLMSIDVKGTFLTTRAAIRSMLKRGGGTIVTMSGTYAYMAEPGTAAHCASKAAILAFTRAVAVEYGDRGIRINAIVPGYVMTEMVQELLGRLEDGKAAQQEIAAWHALGRMAEPREVANMALFLCSDESSFSSGAPFLVDGGMTAGINSWQRPLARPLL